MGGVSVIRSSPDLVPTGARTPPDTVLRPESLAHPAPWGGVLPKLEGRAFLEPRGLVTASGSGSAGERQQKPGEGQAGGRETPRGQGQGWAARGTAGSPASGCRCNNYAN